MSTAPANFAELGITIKTNGSNEQRPPCPECGHVGGFSVDVRSGKFRCFVCPLRGRVGDGKGFVPIARFDDPAVAARKRERLQRVWKEALPLNHTDARAVRSYLESRALGEILNASPAVLRAHRGLEYWDGSKSLGRYPAMLALYHGAKGQPATLHATYLRSDGCAKASVPSPKKILPVPVKGATAGGAIHLYEPKEGILGIAEGIESALSMHLLQKLPVWSSYCADNLPRTRLPKTLRELHIGIDLDSSGKGEEAAQKLANRVLRMPRGPEVFFVRPEGTAPCDLNDELCRR
jgi:putative DNA primase/helicase